METAEVFKCDWEGCDKEFDSKRKLTGHMMSHKRVVGKKKVKNDEPEMTLSEHPQPKGLTAEEAAIFQRVQSETDDWKQISEDELEDFSLIADPFELPVEAKKLQEEKVYAFRWVERKSSRVDEVRSTDPPRRWMIVNKTTCPWLNERDIDPILGCVPRLDQMLMFKPWSWHQKVQAAKHELAEGHRDVRRRHGERKAGGSQFMADSGLPEDVSRNIKIGSGDVVIQDEGDYDAAMGITDDSTELEILEM